MFKHLCGSGRRERIERIARRVAALAVAVPVARYGVSPAMAQEAAPENVASPETIVVTASKREENLQSAPLSITALTGDTLSEHQVTSLDDYVKLLPSVSYQSFGPGQSQINFRGITTGGDGIVTGPLPTAGVYVDETPVTTIANALDIHIYDMARVEALSGPQGTLYGASSLSGTLRLITNKPVIGKWEGGVDVGGSKYGPGDAGGSFEGFLNIPINDRMAARVVAYVEHDGGYISNTFTNRTYLRPVWVNPSDPNSVVNDFPLTVNNAKYVENNFNYVDSYGGRAALKIDLDENWTLTPTVFVQDQLAHGSFLEDPKLADLQVHDFNKDFNKDDWELASLTLQGKVSDWDLTYNPAYLSRRVDNVSDYSYFVVAYDKLAQTVASDSGYTYLKDSLGNDIDPTQTVHTSDHYTKQSHELRISSPAGARLRGTAGAYYQRQTDGHIADYRVHGLSAAVNAFSPSFAGAPPDDVFYTDLYRVDRDYALFGEGAFDLTKELTLIAGIRGFNANNTLFGFSGGAGSLAQSASVNHCAVVNAIACPNTDKAYQESGETHKAELKWQIDPAKMTYFIYSTGFRPGGNNRPAYITTATGARRQDLPPFAADTLTNYEIGWKTSWLDRKLYLNGAIFWEVWNKIQYSEPGILGIFYTVNAGDARSRGVETQVLWKATPATTVTFNGTYADARLTTPFCNQQFGCNPANGGQLLAPAGTPLPVTPKIKLNSTAKYNFEVGKYDAYVQAGLNYQGDTTSYLRTSFESVIGPTGGFTTFDLSGGMSLDKTTVTAYVNNMFDNRGVLSKNSACVPSTCGPYERNYIVKPQLFGVKVGYKF
jgi:iron complex outermembrane recepter protein